MAAEFVELNGCVVVEMSCVWCFVLDAVSCP